MFWLEAQNLTFITLTKIDGFQNCITESFWVVFMLLMKLDEKIKYCRGSPWDIFITLMTSDISEYVPRHRNVFTSLGSMKFVSAIFWFCSLLRSHVLSFFNESHVFAMQNRLMGCKHWTEVLDDSVLFFYWFCFISVSWVATEGISSFLKCSGESWPAFYFCNFVILKNFSLNQNMPFLKDVFHHFGVRWMNKILCSAKFSEKYTYHSSNFE